MSSRKVQFLQVIIGRGILGLLGRGEVYGLMNRVWYLMEERRVRLDVLEEMRRSLKGIGGWKGRPLLRRGYRVLRGEEKGEGEEGLVGVWEGRFCEESSLIHLRQ